MPESGGDRGRSSAISRRISANSVLGTASGYRGAGEGASLSVRRYAIRSARSSAFASPSNCMPVPGAGAIRWATNALSASTPRRAVAKRRSARNRPATPPRGQILPTGLARPSASCPPGRPRDRTCNLSAASMSWSALAMPGPTRSVHAAIAATRDLFIWPTRLQLTRRLYRSETSTRIRREDHQIGTPSGKYGFRSSRDYPQRREGGEHENRPDARQQRPQPRSKSLM